MVLKPLSALVRRVADESFGDAPAVVAARDWKPRRDPVNRKKIKMNTGVLKIFTNNCTWASEPLYVHRSVLLPSYRFAIGAPGRIRTCAHGLGNRCSIP